MALAFYPRSVRLEPLETIAQIVRELIREQGKQMTHLWSFVDHQMLQLDLCSDPGDEGLVLVAWHLAMTVW
jgi:hypothetical protein